MTVTVPPQLSVAVTWESSAAGTAKAHCTVTLPGPLVIVGAVVSTTVMICAQLAVLPLGSVAVHVRVIVLVLPQPATMLSLLVTVALPQLSVAVA